MPVSSDPGEAQAPGRAAGGQQCAIEGEPLAVLERQLSAPRVEIDRPRARPQLDLLLGVEALVVDEHLGALAVAPQVVLGQGRSLVGALGLGSD